MLDNREMTDPNADVDFEELISLCVMHIAHGADFETYRQRVAGTVQLPDFIFPGRVTT